MTERKGHRSWTLVTAGALILAAGSLGAATAEPVVAREAGERPPGSVARGEYLVHAMGCHDCHTPKKMGPEGPEPDFTRALIGHPEASNLPAPPQLPPGPWMVVGTWDLTAWSGPWGISYSINLTPDQNTGLGIWTEEMFVKAMRTGRHMGASRPILPPMAWQALAGLDDADLKAIFAYLRSLPPVKNRVPDAVVAEPPPAAK